MPPAIESFGPTMITAIPTGGLRTPFDSIAVPIGNNVKPYGIIQSLNEDRSIANVIVNGNVSFSIHEIIKLTNNPTGFVPSKWYYVLTNVMLVPTIGRLQVGLAVDKYIIAFNNDPPPIHPPNSYSKSLWIHLEYFMQIKILQEGYFVWASAIHTVTNKPPFIRFGGCHIIGRMPPFARSVYNDAIEEGSLKSRLLAEQIIKNAIPHREWAVFEWNGESITNYKITSFPDYTTCAGLFSNWKVSHGHGFGDTV